MLASALDTGHVDLFPLDGYVVGLEHGLDCLGNFATDTVTCVYISVSMRNLPCYSSCARVGHTWDQRNCILSAILCRLEDIGLDSGIGCDGSVGRSWGRFGQLDCSHRARKGEVVWYLLARWVARNSDCEKKLVSGPAAAHTGWKSRLPVHCETIVPETCWEIAGEGRDNYLAGRGDEEEVRCSDRRAFVSCSCRLTSERKLRGRQPIISRIRP